MCLIGVSWRAHPRHALVLAANRDEFHARPSAPAAPWPGTPDVIGGRDLRSGGSWLAVSARRRLAAVTNVRRMIPPRPDAPSRGNLVSNFVIGTMSARDYAASLSRSAAAYSGFNLLLWDGHELRYVDNHPEFEDQPVSPGVHVVSNDQLDTPWPKSLRLQAVLAHHPEPATLFAALADRVPARDEALPDTGVGRELERLLSPPFVITPDYGTRCSTVVTADARGMTFSERRFDADGRETGRSEHRL